MSLKRSTSSVSYTHLDVYKRQALTGVNTPAQADENCSAFDWELTEEEIAMIDSEIKRLEIG